MSGAKFQIQFLFVLILLVSFSFCKERWNRRRRPINKMADPERLRKFVSGERLKEYQTLAREKRDVTNGYNQVNVTIKALFNYGCNIHVYNVFMFRSLPIQLETSTKVLRQSKRCKVTSDNTTRC